MKEKMVMKESEPDAQIYHRLPVTLYKRIVDFANTKEYRTRTGAINDLIHIGLVVSDNLDKIQDPQLVSELRGQIHEGGLVHYIQSLNPNQVEVLWSIIDTEMKSRNQQWRGRFEKGKK